LIDLGDTLLKVVNFQVFDMQAEVRSEHSRIADLKRSTDACSLVWREGYDLEPRTIFDVALAGWMNRQQQEASEYLRTENRVLREKLGHKRLILNESQKRRLAEAAGKLGKDLLRQVGTLFSPETILNHGHHLVAQKHSQ